MNQSQIHLALTHVPVILSLTGLVVLAISLIRKNPAGTRISYYILLAAGIFSLPVFFSGEGAEEAVENLPGVSEAFIEKHESIAKISFWVILATAFMALAGLIRKAGNPFLRFTKYAVLVFALVSAGLMAYTAHLGGQVRHTEIQGGLAMNDAGDGQEEAGNETGGDENGDNEKDDDD